MCQPVPAGANSADILRADLPDEPAPGPVAVAAAARRNLPPPFNTMKESKLIDRRHVRKHKLGPN